MFKKVLVANRGEVALRIIRASRELGIKTVAVYSEADANALHLKRADESYLIGPPPSTQSYLNMGKILEIAKKTRSDAIHTGYGFLSQSATFAKRCEEDGVKFVGPGSEAIRIMGSKIEARRAMHRAGVSIVPGSFSPLADVGEALDEAAKVDYPVFVKAVSGGGGKGIRLVRSRGEMENAFNLAKVEAKNSFGDSSLYIEKKLEDPRHIEFQVLGDEHGGLVHLNERECSIQRKNQKIIEEAPSPMMTPKLRDEMGAVALHSAKAVDYTNAGTVEFLYDKEGHYYFLEMNTRLQVEHLVTERVTGVDIVQQQLLIASGEKLPFKQGETPPHGWAINCRINAEDPSRDYLPCPGVVARYFPPGGHGVRVDSALFSGCIIPIYYDSLIAKVTTWGHNREEAIKRLLNALEDFIAEGITTNLNLHKKILTHEKFRSGEIDINFIQKWINPADIMSQDEFTRLSAISSAVAEFILHQQTGRVPTSRHADSWSLISKREAIGTGKLRPAHYVAHL